MTGTMGNDREDEWDEPMHAVGRLLRTAVKAGDGGDMEEALSHIASDMTRIRASSHQGDGKHPGRICGISPKDLHVSALAIRGLPFSTTGMIRSFKHLPALAKADPGALIRAATMEPRRRIIINPYEQGPFHVSTFMDGLLRRGDTGPLHAIISMLAAIGKGMALEGSPVMQWKRMRAAVILHGAWSPIIAEHIDDEDAIRTVETFQPLLLPVSHTVQTLPWVEDLLSCGTLPTADTISRLCAQLETDTQTRIMIRLMASAILTQRLTGITIRHEPTVVISESAMEATSPEGSPRFTGPLIRVRERENSENSHDHNHGHGHADAKKSASPSHPVYVLKPEWEGEAAVITMMVEAMQSLDPASLQRLSAMEDGARMATDLLRDYADGGPSYACELFKTRHPAHRQPASRT